MNGLATHGMDVHESEKDRWENTIQGIIPACKCSWDRQWIPVDSLHHDDQYQTKRRRLNEQMNDF